MNVWWADLTLYEAEYRLRAAMVRWALKQEQGHHQRAAKRLGVHRNEITRTKLRARPAAERTRSAAVTEGTTECVFLQPGSRKA